MGWKKKQQGKIMKALSAQAEARAALAALPDDTPPATREFFTTIVADADAAVKKENDRLAFLESRGRYNGGTAPRLLGVFLLVVLGGWWMLSSSTPVPSSPSRDHSPSVSLTFYPREQSAFSLGAGANIACQKKGYIGAIIEDFVCVPDALGDCAKAEVTIVCTRSRQEQEENRRILAELSRQ